MKILLNYDNYPSPFGDELILHLPKNLRSRPPEFIWMRFQHQRPPDCRIPQYDGDGTLAVSNDSAGPIFPVRFKWCVRIAALPAPFPP